MATDNSRVIIFHITSGGQALCGRIATLYPEAECVKYSREAVAHAWPAARALIFIMASGIAVRCIAPLIKDKTADPAVLVMDEKGLNIISLLGGHEAGANELATQIATHIDANAVITTGTDANDIVSVDIFAKQNGLVIEGREALPALSRRHIERGALGIYSERPCVLPKGYRAVPSPDDADVIISPRIHNHSRALMLRPRTLVLGIGLNSGTATDELTGAIDRLMMDNNLSPLSLKCIATHEKKASEQGLIGFAKARGLRIWGISPQELNSVPDVTHSEAAKRALGVNAVAEPSAVIASYGGALIVRKHKSGNLTLAIAEAQTNTISVIGTGPGGLDHITPAALNAIRNADVIVGYKAYVALIEPLLHDKDVVATTMTEEVKRARSAVEIANSGRRVAVISGGDAGVYGMAGLIYEVIDAMGLPVEVDVIPGISALNACASALGAPLMHDFAAISLSDRLTPWEVIERRLEAAASADFVIALYNPKSKGRRTQLSRAMEIISRHRPPATPVGIVEAAMRPDQHTVATTLSDLPLFEVGMRSTVIIGNSMSFRTRGRIVTPRGYGRKYDLA